MKKVYTILLCVISVSLQAQDIPLFSQKMTNSFMYNPAVAGHSSGSLTYSFRQSFTQIQNSPKTNFLSLHTPLANHRFGFGANVFQEDVNFLRTTYASGAFAYHLKFNQSNVLSFGVSGEYNSLQLNGRTNSSTEDPDYLKLASSTLNDYDVSFGMLFHNRYVKAGAAANRLATAWIKTPENFVLTNFYSGFIQGMIPMRGGDDMLEPYFAFRKFAETNTSYDIGLYYTFNDLLMAGAALRKGPVASLTAGVRINKKVTIGYSHEIFLGDIRSQVGATNEFTIRLDFNEYSYKSNFKADYKNAVAYRRKVLSTTQAPRTPSQLHSQQKKFVKYSPNKRYQTTPQLSKITYSDSKIMKKKKARPRMFSKQFNPVRKKRR